MFAPDGYASLADLWGAFERERFEWCRKRACMHIEARAVTGIYVPGAPLDLCEDLFLATLEKYPLSLITTSGNVFQTAGKLQNSNVNLFTKATVLESTAIASDPAEAGVDAEWVTRMGGMRFASWTREQEDFSAWVDTHCSGAFERGPTGSAFHTLPCFFERTTFTVAKDLPPWTADLIEGSIVRNLPEAVRGASICVETEKATTWHRRLKDPELEWQFDRIIDAVNLPAKPLGSAKVGQPNKVEDVRRAYIELGFLDSELPWKEIHAQIVEALGKEFSPNTLRRAASLAAQSQKADE